MGIAAGLAPRVPKMQAEIARITYRYLRWLMVLLPAVLFVVTVAYAAIQQNLETSISAYYGTPVRDVFVGETERTILFTNPAMRTLREWAEGGQRYVWKYVN
jgi:hypothetical protein